MENSLLLTDTNFINTGTATDKIINRPIIIYVVYLMLQNIIIIHQKHIINTI